MSEDLREDILNKIAKDNPGTYEWGIQLVRKQDVLIAMDEYFESRSMELLEWMAKNVVDCGCGENKDMFLYKGECLTKEELFQNFL